jgi:hypothetical protein
VSDYDLESPALQVRVYEGRRLVARIPCETPDEAAEIASAWEEQPGYTCEVVDLGARHEPDDILTTEPEDLVLEEEYPSGEFR